RKMVRRPRPLQPSRFHPRVLMWSAAVLPPLSRCKPRDNVSRLKEHHALGTLIAEDWRMLAADAVIIKDREILGGTPVFRGTRVPFQALPGLFRGRTKS